MVDRSIEPHLWLASEVEQGERSDSGTVCDDASIWGSISATDRLIDPLPPRLAVAD